MKNLFRGKPLDVDQLHYMNIYNIMPKMSDIPNTFYNGHTKWNQLFSDWFFCGLVELHLTVKEGIDKQLAMEHIKTVMISWDSKHQDKEAAVAYMCSLWFDDATWVKKEK